MKIEQQVVSLELAKKLKELGVKQESLFWWVNAGTCFGTASYIEHHETFTLCADWELPEAKHFDEFGGLYFSAYTVAELGEMLPWKTKQDIREGYFTQAKNNPGDEYYKEHQLQYITGDTAIFSVMADTEADARAKMLIYLLENELIEL